MRRSKGVAHISVSGLIQITTSLAKVGIDTCPLLKVPPMADYTKTEIWDLAAGTFIAVSVVGGLALIIASAIQ